MTRFGAPCLAILLLALAAAPGWTEPEPGHGGVPTVAPVVTRPVPPEKPQPYPMNYADEVAQSLGVHNGNLDLLPPAKANPYAPSVSVGGGMLRLRWHP